MRIRPTSVTVIGWLAMAEAAGPWILIVFSLLALTASGRSGPELANFLPHGTRLAETLIFLAGSVGCGIGLLRGSNVARWLYVVWLGGHALWEGVSVAHDSFSSLLFLLGFFLRSLVVATFLFMPRASRWFAGDDSDPGEAYGAGTAVCFVVGIYALDVGVRFGLSPQWAVSGICAFMGIGCVGTALAATGWRRVGRDLAMVAAGVALLVGPGLPRLIQNSRVLTRQSLPASRTPEGRYAVAEARLVRAGTAALPRFNALGRAAKAAYDAGHYDEARTLAQELEKAVPDHVGEWDYGNAIQDSNVVLGRLALREGDVDEAKARLLAAGGSPGSPQMDSFGPNVSLAADLLAKGETEAVLQYFAACRSFWTMDHGQLDAWTEAVKRGETPRFGANLIY